jgi:hypothetical protein
MAAKNHKTRKNLPPLRLEQGEGLVPRPWERERVAKPGEGYADENKSCGKVSKLN